LQGNGWRSRNMPRKLVVIAEVDSMTQEARGIGASNTVVV
jgi:shikimate 5-dehydrogenase